MPAQILQLAPHQRHALIADASRARIYVFENVEGKPVLLRHYYMSVGRNGIGKQVEGDKRTPLGIYTLNEYIPRARLTDFYGAGAFPMNYPNDWDLTQGKTGHGIWLHGVPSDTYNRAPRASDGCVVVANPDLTELSQFVQVGVTPIVITEAIDWLTPEAWQSSRQELLGKLDHWKSDWERQDADHFLAHYSPQFLTNEGRNWAESKRRNIGNKDWIRLDLRDISLFSDPTTGLAEANFTQEYDSNALRSTSRKRLYITREQEHWRIALEKNFQPLPMVAASEQLRGTQ